MKHFIRGLMFAALVFCGAANAACPSPVNPTVTGTPYYDRPTSTWCLQNLTVNQAFQSGTSSITSPLVVNGNTGSETQQTGTIVQEIGANGTAARNLIDVYGSSALYTGLRFDGTKLSKTALLANDIIMGVNAWGYNGTAPVGPLATMDFYAGENYSATNNGTGIQWSTTPNGATQVLAPQMALLPSGLLVHCSVCTWPFVNFQINGTSSAQNFFGNFGNGAITNFVHYDNTVNSYAHTFLKTRALSEGSFAIVNNGDQVLRIFGVADDGVTFNTQVAEIDAVVNAAPAATSVPGELNFRVATNAVPSVLTRAFRIQSDLAFYAGSAGTAKVIDNTGQLFGPGGIQAVGTGAVNLSPTGGSGTVTVNPATASAINNESLGITVPAAAKFTALSLTAQWQSATPPTIASGGCTSPSVAHSNGTAVFEVTIGSACGGSTITFTFPAAPFKWFCKGEDLTSPASNIVDETSSSTTAVVMTNYARTTGIASNFTASEDVIFQCGAT